MADASVVGVPERVAEDVGGVEDIVGRERFVGRWEVRSEVVGMESVPEPEADMLAVGEEGDVEVVRMVRLEWVVVPFTGS